MGKYIKTYKLFEEVTIDTKYLGIVNMMIFGNIFEEIEQISDNIEIMGFEGDHIKIEIDAYHMTWDEEHEPDTLKLETIEEIYSDFCPFIKTEIEKFTYEWDDKTNKPKMDKRLYINLNFDKDFQEWWMGEYGEDRIEDLLFICKDKIDKKVYDEYPEIQVFVDSKELGLL